MTDWPPAETSDLPAAGLRPETPWRWFVRGTAVGMLLMAALNAVSYFFRSDNWSGLVGRPESRGEAMGFPLVIWEAGNSYGGMFADYPNLGWNILIAAAVGSLLGGWSARRTDFLNQLTNGLQQQGIDRQHQPLQFSVRGLLIATAITALVVAVAKQYAARPETLIAIYALGPLALVVIAMMPQRLSWQKRVMIIIPTTFALIAVAMAVGVTLGMEFDKVLMGIYVCWTPQSVLAALGLTTWILVGEAKRDC